MIKWARSFLLLKQGVSQVQYFSESEKVETKQHVGGELSALIYIQKITYSRNFKTKNI